MITIKNLSKSFESRSVLDSLDLNISKGQTMVIIGQSGCGKSVLLKHIIGLIKPDVGSVHIDNVDITQLSGRALDELRMKFGMLFQGAALFDSLDVFENVAFSLREHTTMGEKEIGERVRECLGLVGLTGVEEHMPSELSGGMRKRVGLARAVSMQPDIILYDEPTTGIDPIMADVINQLIVALRDKLKVTSIVVTHDIVSAYKVADRIAMLYNGKIVVEGTPEEIRSSTDARVRQFVHGEATGPITEGMPARKLISRRKLPRE